MTHRNPSHGFYYQPRSTSAIETHATLRKHNSGRQKPGMSIHPRDPWTGFASAARDLAFAPSGSAGYIPRDVFGRQSATTSSTNAMKTNMTTICGQNDGRAGDCPGVSYGVLPRGRTATRRFPASTAGLYGVSWASSPQTGYKRASAHVHTRTPTIVESAPRTPGTPLSTPGKLAVARSLSGKSVSSPGGGRYRTPQDNSCPGRPARSHKTAGGWSL